MLVLAMVILTIIGMKWQENRGIVHPDKAVWKEITTNDFSKWDTALANFYQHHSLVHPATLVWKEITSEDSVYNNRSIVR